MSYKLLKLFLFFQLVSIIAYSTTGLAFAADDNLELKVNAIEQKWRQITVPKVCASQFFVSDNGQDDGSNDQDHIESINLNQRVILDRQLMALKTLHRELDEVKAEIRNAKAKTKTKDNSIVTTENLAQLKKRLDEIHSCVLQAIEDIRGRFNYLWYLNGLKNLSPAARIRILSQDQSQQRYSERAHHAVRAMKDLGLVPSDSR